nr:hypothetical protein [Streptomyces sp. SID5473]
MPGVQRGEQGRRIGVGAVVGDDDAAAARQPPAAFDTAGELEDVPPQGTAQGGGGTG